MGRFKLAIDGDRNLASPAGTTHISIHVTFCSTKVSLDRLLLNGNLWKTFLYWWLQLPISVFWWQNPMSRQGGLLYSPRLWLFVYHIEFRFFFYFFFHTYKGKVLFLDFTRFWLHDLTHCSFKIESYDFDSMWYNLPFKCSTNLPPFPSPQSYQYFNHSMCFTSACSFQVYYMIRGSKNILTRWPAVESVTLVAIYWAYPPSMMRPLPTSPVTQSNFLVFFCL